MSRVAQAAIEAALEDEQPRRRRLSGMHAVAAGAALATAARFAVKKAPDFLLPDVPSVSDLAGSVRDRLADNGWIEDAEPDEPEDILEDQWDEPEDEEEDEPPDDEGEEEDEPPEDEEDEEETPEDEGEDGEDDGGDDDTDDDGPQASDDEDWEDEEDEADDEEEPEEEPAPAIELGTNGDGRESAARGGAPDLMRALATHRRPPVMGRRRQNEIDPAGRPLKRPRQSKS